MPRSLWRNPDFLKLWTGQSISQIGSRISREGIPFAAVLTLRASTLQMGLLSGAGALGVLLFGLFAGAWADRLRRRPVMIAADLGRAAVLSVIPLAAFTHRLSIVHLYFASALSAILAVLFDSSYQSYLPALVEKDDLLEGNSKLALTESIAEVAGPNITGVLVQWITAPLAILFDAISFVVSAISLAWIGKPEPLPTPPAQPHILREISEGLKVCWNNRVLRALLASIAIGTFSIGFISALYILYATELGLKPAVLGPVIAVGGIANLAGSLLAPKIAGRFGLGLTRIGSAVVLGFGALLLPLAHGSVWMCALFLSASQIFDAAWPVLNVVDRTLRQKIVPEHLLGRVNSAMLLMFRGVLPLGAVAGGALAQVIGTRPTLFAGAIGFLLSSLWLLFSPVRRE
jgi:MFS family permease